MYIQRFLLLLRSISVISSPLLLLDDAQPQLGASLTLLGNSACPRLLGYGSLPSSNVTKAGNVTIASQTAYVSATQTGISPAINSSASIAAPPLIGVPLICTKIKEVTLNNYEPTVYNFPGTLLSPDEYRTFVFKFVRTGGQRLQIIITGRSPNSPDKPKSYFIIANHAFVAGNLENEVEFSITELAWVNVQLLLDSGVFSYRLGLFQLDSIA